MRRCWSCPTCWKACARSAAPRARAARRSSSASPARSARPAPRRRCGSRCRAAARPMRRRRPTTITGACRCRWRAARESARFAVLEMGMNHAGEISPLTRLVRPHVAIVTTVEPVHLEFFGSVETIADAKAEIFEGIEPGGAAVINRDNPQFARLAARGEERRRRPHRLVRRAREGRCAARQVRAAAGFLDRAGAHPRRRRHLQARRAGPPSHPQFAGGAGGGEARRRRSRARGAGARRSRARDRPRRAHRRSICRAAARS